MGVHRTLPVSRLKWVPFTEGKPTVIDSHTPHLPLPAFVGGGGACLGQQPLRAMVGNVGVVTGSKHETEMDSGDMGPWVQCISAKIPGGFSFSQRIRGGVGQRSGRMIWVELSEGHGDDVIIRVYAL